MARFNPDVISELSGGINASIDQQHDIADNELIDLANMEYFDDGVLMARRGVKNVSDTFPGPITSIHGIPGGVIVTVGDQVYSSSVIDTGAKLVAIGADGAGLNAYSVDGSAWLTPGPQFGSPITGAGVAYSATQRTWVAVSQDASNNIQTSGDGITWTPRGKPIGWTTGYSVCYAPEIDLWVVGGGGGTATLGYATTVSSWTPNGTLLADVYGLAWSPTLPMFVAVGVSNASGIFAHSADGINWTADGTPVFQTRARGVAWSPTLNLFCAVGLKGISSDSIATSTDGINWTGRGTGGGVITTEGQCICWSEDLGIFVAGAKNSSTYRLAWSADGSNWHGVTAPMHAVNSVCWSAELGMFFAAGDPGAGAEDSNLAYSPDGLVWTGFGEILPATSGWAVGARP